MKIELFFFLGLGAGMCSGANILGMFPLPTYSHTHGYLPILEELARRGHNVTVLSPFPRKEPLVNYTDIVIPNTASKTITSSKLNLKDVNNFILTIMGPTMYCEQFLEPLFKLPELTAFINEDRSHFDLIITESFFCQGPFAALAHKYSAHRVAVSADMMGSKEAFYSGNTLPYSYLPQQNLGTTDKMSFATRALSSFIHISRLMLQLFVYEPKEDRYIRQYFKYPGSANIPPLRDILMNHSLIMVDFHTSMSFPRPFLPNVVEYGGVTIKEAETLPEDLEGFMSGAQEGVVYFSWGSFFKSSKMPQEALAVFLSVFSKLRQRVLLKWDEQDLPGKPDNVRIAKWFPQPGILAHPNLKVFISHCGIHGLYEATYHAVPILGTPLFSDQFQNSKVPEKAGYGINLDIYNLSEELVLESLNKLIYDPSYKEAAKKHSKIFKDRPIPALDNAAYWIEYVLRHNGARHLRPASLDLSWYQYFLLDVIGMALLILLLLFLVAFCVFGFILRVIKSFAPVRKSKED